MKEDIMQKLGTILGVLNNISVSGKQNLANLSGSIAILEELANMLSECDIIVHNHSAPDAK